MAQPIKHTLKRIVFFTVIVCFSSACQKPIVKIDDFARKAGFTKSTLMGQPFEHVIYTRNTQADTQNLNIYIEGDGSPWQRGSVIADDPTPKQPLLLHLMAQDTSKALYLGRPCYFGLSRQAACTRDDWTFDRYSPKIIKSMVHAANTYISDYQIKDITLIGHSGGGALAVLMADKIPGVNKVITIAANLDTTRWTKYHGYLPLEGSLNPMKEANLFNREHIHYAGSKDTAVPVEIIAAFVKKHGGTLKVIPEFTHHCCWQTIWPEVLAESH